MNKSKWLKRFRKFHKWPGIIISVFVILFAISGIIMNHRTLVSSVDIPRKILPSNYEYSNWNLAAVRGSLHLSGDTSLIFGNAGIWKTPDDFINFADFNQGFPKGIDNRKINAMAVLPNGNQFAGTQFGLYNFKNTDEKWVEVKLPVENKRIADLIVKNDTLIILTRDYLLKYTDHDNIQIIQLPEQDNYTRKTGLFNTLWELHSGELFGIIGKLLVDLFGVAVIFLSITGLLHLFFPKIIRKRKKVEKPVEILVRTKRLNLKWHNVVGYIFVLFLVINTFSGMHLRPPLLIAIANKQVGIIPYSHLDTPNPWHDKLRRVAWDENLGIYIFSTSEGFFYTGETLKEKLIAFTGQPPVSIMGCNVLEKFSEGKYLVGSFSGMYIWDIFTGKSFDYFSKQQYQKPEGMEIPVGENMVAGLIHKSSGEKIWFYYNEGSKRMTSHNGMSSFPDMPEEIVKKTPISLWNVALEVHTGRVFEKYTGPFYILYVPLAGICILLVLISGFFIWWLGYKKKAVRS
ncbi:MAG: PepSY domain-containing protein [Prolixibacteraceae bacterium]|nr:PepSY domain-containing protein [Prolixibacteraceae bacterium]